MSDTQGTTAAQESATPDTHKRPGQRKPRRDHLVWVGELRLGLEMGVEVRSFCGIWVKPWDPDGTEIEVVGDLVPLIYKKDCRTCARSYSAFLMRGGQR